MGQLSVCFGYRTALQVLREADGGKVAWERVGVAHLPDRASSGEALDDAIFRLETAYPGLRIDRPAHLILKTTSRCRVTPARVPHACTVPVRGRPINRVLADVGVCSAAFAFTQMATQTKDEIDLLELGYELCGTYRTKRMSAAPAYQVSPLASVRSIRDFTAGNPSLSGARKVARIVRYLADGSASPRETKQALLLGLPLMHGGYGLGIPRMNYEVAATAAARAISGRRSFRCDLCWPDAKLDVEYQSRESHAGEKSRIRDSRRANALAAMGWTVIGVTNDELDSMAATDAIAQAISRCLGRRRQVRVADYHARKLRLRRRLGLGIGYE